MGQRNHVLDGVKVGGNPFAATRGESMAVWPFVNIFWHLLLLPLFQLLLIVLSWFFCCLGEEEKAARCCCDSVGISFSQSAASCCKTRPSFAFSHATWTQVFISVTWWFSAVIQGDCQSSCWYHWQQCQHWSMWVSK